MVEVIDDTRHGTPADKPHKEETSAYSDKVIDDELQRRRRSWQGVLPEETWAQLTNPIINITTDDFVGNRESDDIQEAWREMDIRIT